MTAVDRYLKRVAFWLPRRGREDVIEELRGALLDRMREAESARGRALTDAEAQQLLGGFGQPAIVVARFGEGSPVISGGLAFFFWRVLVIALLAILIGQAVVFAVEASQAPASMILGEALRRTFVSLLLGFTCVTASFMLLEGRYGR